MCGRSGKLWTFLIGNQTDPLPTSGVGMLSGFRIIGGSFGLEYAILLRPIAASLPEPREGSAGENSLSLRHILALRAQADRLPPGSSARAERLPSSEMSESSPI